LTMSADAVVPAGCDEVEYTLGAFTDANIYQVHPGTVSASGDFLADSWSEKHFITAVSGEILVHGELTRIVMRDMKSKELFAECIVEDEETVVDTIDSSRYVVMKLKDPASGRVAMLGMGWQERSNAYDFKATLKDHQRRMKFRKHRQQQPRQQTRDYNIAPDQKITLNFKKKNGKPKSKLTGGLQSLQLGRGDKAPKPSKGKDAAATNTTTEVDPFAGGFGDVDPFAAMNGSAAEPAFAAVDPFGGAAAAAATGASAAAVDPFGGAAAAFEYDPFTVQKDPFAAAVVDPFASVPSDPFPSSDILAADFNPDPGCYDNAVDIPIAPADGSVQAEEEDIPTKLIQLKKLFDIGVINESDFEQKKRDLLSKY